MKKILTSIIDFLEGLGRARAAADLARLGRYEEAQQLMTERK